MKTEFESRIEFHPYKSSVKRKGARVYYATVFWGGKLYESIKYTKELCIDDLKKKAGINV